MQDQIATPRRSLARHALNTLHHWVMFTCVVAVLGLGFLGTSIAAAVLAVLLPRRLGAPFGRKLIRQGFRFIVALMRGTGLCRIDLASLAPLEHARGLVITPNHPSLLDVVLIVSCLPNAICIIKAELLNNPLLGGTARLAGYIRNDTPLAVVRRAAQELREGANLLVFPEGTRTPPGQRPLGPFRAGFALMALAARAPIQVAFIETDTPYLRKGWPVWRKPELPIGFRACLGERLVVDGPAPAFASRLEARMRAALSRRTGPS